MPTPGLSLVGFLTDQQQAINHLTNACVPTSPDPAALVAEWKTAAAKLGTAVAGAGIPDIRPIPAQHQAYIQQILLQPAFQPPSAPGMPPGALYGSTIELVEIDPLLAFQFTIDAAGSNDHCGHFGTPPPIDQLLVICLPTGLSATRTRAKKRTRTELAAARPARRSRRQNEAVSASTG